MKAPRRRIFIPAVVDVATKASSPLEKDEYIEVSRD